MCPVAGLYAARLDEAVQLGDGFHGVGARGRLSRPRTRRRGPRRGRRAARRPAQPRHDELAGSVEGEHVHPVDVEDHAGAVGERRAGQTVGAGATRRAGRGLSCRFSLSAHGQGQRLDVGLDVRIVGATPGDRPAGDGEPGVAVRRRSRCRPGAEPDVEDDAVTVGEEGAGDQRAGQAGSSPPASVRCGRTPGPPPAPPRPARHSAAARDRSPGGVRPRVGASVGDGRVTAASRQPRRNSISSAIVRRPDLERSGAPADRRTGMFAVPFPVGLDSAGMGAILAIVGDAEDGDLAGSPRTDDRPVFAPRHPGTAR